MVELRQAITRVCALPAELHPRAVGPLLREWAGDIPFVPEGHLLQVGKTAYRVRYRSVRVDEELGETYVIYTVQGAREEPRI